MVLSVDRSYLADGKVASVVHECRGVWGVRDLEGVDQPVAKVAYLNGMVRARAHVQPERVAERQRGNGGVVGVVKVHAIDIRRGPRELDQQH